MGITEHTPEIRSTAGRRQDVRARPAANAVSEPAALEHRLRVANQVLIRCSAGGTCEELATSFLAMCGELLRADYAEADWFDLAAGNSRTLARVPDVPAAASERPLRLIDEAPNERRARMAALGFRQSLDVPLVARGQTLGAAHFWTRRTEPFVPDDTDLVIALAGPLTLALDGATAVTTLAQRQKMESLGTMAGAVAHDFNNLLTTILGFAGLLKSASDLRPEQRENLALIEDAARQAADLTGRLLSFARGGLVRFGPVDLRQVVADTVRLAGPAIPETVSVNVTLPDSPVFAEGDAGQLHQALLNIVLNARDAMVEGGVVDITLGADNGEAVVVVSDTGHGMDEETRIRMFEPFFTTKPSGTSSGLGMAITYGIVQGHHGEIAVETAPAAGTTFTIRLPLGTGSAPETSLPDPGDGNLVLVVDDDEMVRRATCAMLFDLGYAVAPCPGGEMAVEMVRARPDRFSAVMLDLVMPGMTGAEAFHQLRATRPELPVIVCTGFAADKHLDEEMKRRIAGLVRKPFTRDDLGRALQAAGVQPVRPPRQP